MKKILIALCAMFCLSVNAQNDIETEKHEVAVEDSTETVAATPQANSAKAGYVAIDEIISKLAVLTKNGEAVTDDSEKERYAPLKGRSKFTRRNYIYQTLDVSPHVSTDNDPNLPAQTSNGKDVDTKQLESPTGFGMNFGYSLIFVPGHVEGDKLLLNKMGFAYSIGASTSFSKQDKYGTTCNFLLKLGIEAGNGHALGFGFDFLGGYGKSAGDSYQLEYQDYEEDDLAEPYTKWCWQYGSQVWMRTNLIKTVLANTEILIFAKFIVSVDPTNDETMIKGYDYFWKDETWSFGVTFRYRF